MRIGRDIWRPAIVAAGVAEIAARGSLDGFALHWFPDQGRFRFLADPFGLWRDRVLHVFVEHFDYRDPIGRIHVCRFDAALRFIDQRPVLAEPWHLSYPHVFEAEGETWLLPEAYQSRAVTLYRAVEFPTRWEAAHRITLDHVPLDATPLFHDGRWWLFYGSADRREDWLTTLHVASAERLAGPWRPHAHNPVRRDPAGTRPGGTPFVADGRLLLPVQASAGTYGEAVRLLEIDRLSPDAFAATPTVRLTPPATARPFVRGLHTLSEAGPVTLVDVKREVTSLAILSMRPRRVLRGLLRRSVSA